MGALGRVVTGRVQAYSDWDDFWYMDAAIESFAGAKVTPKTALALAAVWRCVNLLASTIAGLPLPVYRRLDDGGKEHAASHPLSDLLQRQPNPWQTAFQFREMLMGHVLLRGNFYAEILAGPRGPVDQLIPIHPDRVEKIEQLRNGSLRYEVKGRVGEDDRVILGEDMFHVMGFSDDGIRGMSVISVARDSFGLGLAMEQYAAALFKRSVRPSGVLTHPKHLSDPARTHLRAAIDELQAGPQNAGRPLLLEEGMDWKQMGLTNRDAEFLASRKHEITVVARWFGIPPHKIMDLERSTNNNIEQQAIEWVVDGVLPWARRIETTISRDLIVATDTYFAEFLLAGLLRGDQKTRYEAYALARQWGWMSVNDIRRRENDNPIQGGDVYLEPLNMVPAGSARASAASRLNGGEPLALPGPSPQLRLLASDAAARLVRREVAAMRKLGVRTGAEGEAWTTGVHDFYEAHGRQVGTTMRIPEHEAIGYAHGQRDELLAGGIAVLDTWEPERAQRLAELAVGQDAAVERPKGDHNQAA